MKIHVMTDLECVAGVVSAPEYCLRGPRNKYGRIEGGRYYDEARRLATLEVNAAVDGLLDGGATEIVVCDGHGHGGLDAALIHERARILTGLPVMGYGIDASFDATIMIGQHAMANTDGGHLCHSGSFARDAWLLNDQVIGEIGLFMIRAACHQVPMVMISGDVAACEEARQLVPSIETVAVIEGVKRGSTKGMTTDQTLDFNVSAVHVSPVRSQRMIREAARRCLQRIDTIERFWMDPPYEMTRITRPDEEGKAYRSVTRADDFLSLDAKKVVYEPIGGEAGG